jgi:hypothetical protein
MAWLGRNCLACRQAQQEIEYLRAQLTAAEERHQALLDRFLAVVDRPALAAVQELRNPEPPRTWAVDETGTSVVLPDGERPVVVDPEGDPCVAIDGELVKVREYEHWMARLHQEASGVSPGSYEK